MLWLVRCLIQKKKSFSVNISLGGVLTKSFFFKFLFKLTFTRQVWGQENVSSDIIRGLLNALLNATSCCVLLWLVLGKFFLLMLTARDDWRGKWHQISNI